MGCPSRTPSDDDWAQRDGGAFTYATSDHPDPIGDLVGQIASAEREWVDRCVPATPVGKHGGERETHRRDPGALSQQPEAEQPRREVDEVAADTDPALRPGFGRRPRP